MTVPVQLPPWRVIRAFQNEENQAVTHLHNVSGGILSGDSLDLSIEAEAGARAQITTVGATRIYRHRAGRETACQSVLIRIDDGALVEYLPDGAIPFAGSRYRQSTSVLLGRDAGFIGWDVLAAGRVARGEEFAFESFSSEFAVRSPDRLVAWEQYELRPEVTDLRAAVRWGRFRYTASLFVCRTEWNRAAWLDLEANLNRIAFDCSGTEERWGVSSLAASGIVIRGMAMEAHQIMAGLHSFWGIAKKEVWDERAIAPRKIN